MSDGEKVTGPYENDLKPITVIINLEIKKKIYIYIYMHSFNKNI